MQTGEDMRKQIHKKSPEQGFSLVELIIVIGLMGILLALAVPPFQEWMAKSSVETQVRQVAADINEVRVRAFTMKRRHSITFKAYSAVFRMYSSETYSSPDKGIPVLGGTRVYRFGLAKKNGSMYSGEVYEFDERGLLVDLGATLFFTGTGTSSAIPNCLTLHTIRVNIGKKNSSGDCDDI